MEKPAYFVIDVQIKDAERIKPYQLTVEATYTAFGGQRIVAAGQVEVLEGDGPRGIVVILQFPSMAQAHAWHESPQYRSILGHRLAAAESHAYLIEGLAPVSAPTSSIQ